MSKTAFRWHVFPDSELLADAACECIVGQAASAITRFGLFRIVLAGGSTPRLLYTKLAQCTADWQNWQVYFGDERCLPAGSAQRNDTMARSAWLNHVPLPDSQVHPIPAELGHAQAVEIYQGILGGIGDFDLVLLGLGEDGHTASLFPGQEVGKRQSSPDVLAVSNAPKPPAERISLSANRLSRSRSVKLLVTGTGKRAALDALRKRKNIPAGCLSPKCGMDVLLDEEARIPGL